MVHKVRNPQKILLMKKRLVFLLVCCFVISVCANAQADTLVATTGPFKKTHVYGGLGISGPLGGVLAGTVILRSRWGGSVTYNALSVTAKELPSDYIGGTGLFNIFEGEDDKVYDDIIAVSLRVLREFPTTSKMVRLGIEAGPSFVTTEVAGNFVYNPNPCGALGCAPNYYFDRVKKNSIGLSLKGKLELAFSPPAGFEIGLTSNINPNRTYFGVDFMITLGYVRDRIRP